MVVRMVACWVVWKAALMAEKKVGEKVDVRVDEMVGLTVALMVVWKVV
jgi:hypothetical protein